MSAASTFSCALNVGTRLKVWKMKPNEAARTFRTRAFAAVARSWPPNSTRPRRVGQAGVSAEVVRAAVLAELRDKGRWLLVFDNAQTPAGIRPWLPGGGGHVLITSRERGWAEIAAPVEVDVLARSESVTLLTGRRKRLLC